METRKPAVIALGMFDGVHIGHQELLGTAASLADALDAVCCVYTFENHPAELLGRHVELLTGAEERRALLSMFGADEVYMERFDETIMHLSPEAFVRRLCGAWHVRGVVAGFNYTFGDRGAGTSDTLRALGKELGFSVMIVPKVSEDGEPVSSSRIRSLLQTGDVRMAARLLGRAYAVSGMVCPNRQNGRKIGFPTANLLPEPGRALPRHGVYVTEAITDAGTFRGVTNIGANPTVHGDRVTIETHLLGFSGELYGKHLEVRFLERIRGEHTFASLSELKTQIREDANAAARYGKE